jgi:hypothetical protein
MAQSEHQSYYDALSEESKMLLVLRDELYMGSWDRMEDDLRNRLKGRPYIFKLVNRIEEDLERIEALRSYEGKHKINLRESIDTCANVSTPRTLRAFTASRLWRSSGPPRYPKPTGAGSYDPAVQGLLRGSARRVAAAHAQLRPDRQ